MVAREMSRRKFLALSGGVLGAAATGRLARAEEKPAQKVELDKMIENMIRREGAVDWKLEAAVQEYPKDAVQLLMKHVKHPNFNIRSEVFRLTGSAGRKTDLTKFPGLVDEVVNQMFSDPENYLTSSDRQFVLQSAAEKNPGAVVSQLRKMLKHEKYPLVSSSSEIFQDTAKKVDWSKQSGVIDALAETLQKYKGQPAARHAARAIRHTWKRHNEAVRKVAERLAEQLEKKASGEMEKHWAVEMKEILTAEKHKIDKDEEED